ncbi:unnamed protein product, partial [Protopolystoma xenopodis]
MEDFFRNAFSYFGNSSSNRPENDFIGQNVEVGTRMLRVKRLIAEGGYGTVFEAVDQSKGQHYALKRLLAHDEETSKSIIREIEIIKKLSGHPNIITFVSAASVGKEKSRHIGAEFLIVTEFCRGGQLTDHLPAPRQGILLSHSLILQIMHQISSAVQHMHQQSPPIIHRDLKMENLLLTDSFILKLCDYGSASTKTFSPDPTWSALQRSRVQEE